ncbi:NAD(P)/FAD-dependent oxidoreductase [Ancylobacter mangrovi]|uniref:NAD(P)/FAD-dependent oxidoreductase n=1 Tax=Ancylobacter mangrovi TaxID=2972472 RepID=UPI002162F12D|nr:FAD-dependent oxidoreductase [Ancylobacter mangrovi]MCS0505174.1 FAD-dependent oxidoreductase [Ancylobacter mangrovi]
MDLSNFTTDPYWWDAAPPEDALEPLPARADVVVVGSGYSGLSAAAELARNGTDVVVVDAEALGAGASTRSGGMVSSGQKMVMTGAVRGKARERVSELLADSVDSFQHIENLIAQEKLDAGYQKCGRYFAAYVPKHYERLRRQGELLQEMTGVTVHNVPRSEQHGITQTDFYHGGIVVDDYGGLHPGMYARALRDLARRCGARLFSHAPVRAIRREGAQFTVTTGRGTILAREVIVATNGYTGAAMPELRKRVIPVYSYQIATEPLPPELMARINPGRRMISDSQRELYYTRPSPDGTRVLFGSRPSFYDMNERAAGRNLAAKLEQVWPQLSKFRITHSWRGKVAMTFDKVAHMGEEQGIHFAVGCNGNGVALMTYLGHQTALKLLGTANRPCAFDRTDFPTEPYYSKRPWFVPIVSAWYHLRDGIDRTLS